MLQDARRKITQIASQLAQSAAPARRALGTADGRWTLVSSSLTASVAFAVTWLALAAQPASTARAVGAGAHPRKELALIPAPILPSPVEHLIEQQQPAKPLHQTRTLRVGDGDTIMGMLADAGVPIKDANAVVDAMRPLFSPRSIRSGQTFEATFGDADDVQPIAVAATDADDDESVGARTRRLLSLSFSPSIERQITVSLSAPDGYMAHDIQKKLEGRYQHAGGDIDSSLYLAAMQAGIPANIVVELIRVFSYDVDFQRDVHPGDSFDVFYNHFFTQDGQPAKPGDILEASMTLSGRTHTLYRYENDNGDVEYFDATGRSAKGMLMKTPVDGARISSVFGAREHPILGYTRMHKGIDFAVPKGTPVMAAGNGTVTFAGVQRGFGNIIIISHGNGYATAYAHLSRFLAHKGARVHQGQIVAYSGMTGMATGPHLHYEIRVNNTQVNPATVKVASGRTLAGSELRAFQSERHHIDTLVASMPMEHHLALVSGLRDTTE